MTKTLHTLFTVYRYGWMARHQKTAQCALSDSSLPHYCKHSKSKLCSEHRIWFSLLFILQCSIALLFQPIKIQGCVKRPVSAGPWSTMMTISVRKRSGCLGNQYWTEESTGWHGNLRTARGKVHYKQHDAMPKQSTDKGVWNRIVLSI